MENKYLGLLLLLLLDHRTYCFQWSPLQQSSHVINAYLGSNAKLPCQFTLTDQEEQQRQQFLAVIWMREAPFGSQKWEGLASTTYISGLNDSVPQIISPDKNKFTLSNNYLTIFKVEYNDDTQYQCEVKSSFYAPPSLIKVNVVYKPFDTRIIKPTDSVEQNSSITINCTAKANPRAGFSFYHNNQLIQNSTSQYYVINNTMNHHEGEYTCIPWNYYGFGPSDSFDLKVKDVKITDEKFVLSDEIIAGIVGAVVLVLIVIVVAAIVCQRLRSEKKERQSSAKDNRDLKESHLGPAMYGSDASIATSTTKTSNRDLNGSNGGSAIYGSDTNIGSSNNGSLKFMSDIDKQQPIFYGPESDFSLSNGRYTQRDHKLFKLHDGGSNGVTVDSNT